MNSFNPIEFAIASANEAFDQRAAYADPVGSYFDNVVDTLNEYKVTGQMYHSALAQYRATVANLFFGMNLEYEQLFDALSHAGVHEIECETDLSNNDRKDGSLIYLKHNGAHFGTIGQDYVNPNKWAIYMHGVDTINGEGFNLLLDTIKQIRKY